SLGHGGVGIGRERKGWRNGRAEGDQVAQARALAADERPADLLTIEPDHEIAGDRSIAHGRFTSRSGRFTGTLISWTEDRPGRRSPRHSMTAGWVYFIDTVVPARSPMHMRRVTEPSLSLSTEKQL